MFTEEMHGTSVDKWAVGHLIATSGVVITIEALDKLKYALLDTNVDKRSDSTTALQTVIQIHRDNKLSLGCNCQSNDS